MKIREVKWIDPMSYKGPDDLPIDSTNFRYGRFAQTLLRREPVLNLELDLPFGDAPISYNIKKLGMRWKKVQNYLANRYPN